MNGASQSRSRRSSASNAKRFDLQKKPGQNDYDADYEACEGLRPLAQEFPGLAFIVAHHDRKLDADDVFDTVSGTLGLTGGVDTIAILKRRAQGVTLYVEGRDLIESVEKAVKSIGKPAGGRSSARRPRSIGLRIAHASLMRSRPRAQA